MQRKMGDHHNRYEPRYDERESNPHLKEYNPNYQQPVFKPVYQQFPQPDYKIWDGVYYRTHPAYGDRYEDTPRGHFLEHGQHHHEQDHQHSPRRHQDHSPRRHEDHSPRRHQDHSPRRHQDHSPHRGPAPQHHLEHGHGNHHHDHSQPHHVQGHHHNDYEPPEQHSPRRHQDRNNYQPSPPPVMNPPQRIHGNSFHEYGSSHYDVSGDTSVIHIPARKRRQVNTQVMLPAGRANNFNLKITDLLTSIRTPQQKDMTMRTLMEANKGYLVMMRFKPDDLSEVVTGVQENLSTLAAHHGYVIGFADPANMRIMKPSYQMVASDQWWDTRDRNASSKFSVCCFWFKDSYQGKRWFESTKRFMQPNFPNYNKYQAVAVPLTYGRNEDPLPFGPDSESVTLLWAEFPHIYERYHQDFLDNFSEPARRKMVQYGANPYVSMSKFQPGWPNEPVIDGQPEYNNVPRVQERVARPIREPWLLANTFITVSTFRTMEDVSSLFQDSEFRELQGRLSNHSDAVFLSMTLRRVRGTSRT